MICASCFLAQTSKHAEAAAAQSLEAVKSLAKLRAELSQSAEELEEREAHCAAEAAADASLLMRSAVAEVEERKDDHAAALNSSHVRVRTADSDGIIKILRPIDGFWMVYEIHSAPCHYRAACLEQQVLLAGYCN